MLWFSYLMSFLLSLTWLIPWRFYYIRSAQPLKNGLFGLHKIQWPTRPNDQAAPACVRVYIFKLYHQQPYYFKDWVKARKSKFINFCYKLTTLKSSSKERNLTTTILVHLSYQSKCKSLPIKHKEETVHIPQHVNLGKLSVIKKSVQLCIQW